MSPIEHPRTRMLLVDDDPGVRRDYARILGRVGDVVTACDGSEALEQVSSGNFDVVVSDVAMPSLGGLEFLRKVRERDLDLPIILMTGEPGLQSAVEAVEYGACRYLIKPIPLETLTDAVRRAASLHRVARLKREALDLLGTEGRSLGDRASLDAKFTTALNLLWIAYQPIVLWSERRVFAYEALVRSDEPSLARPGDLFDAAERLDRLDDLGRAVRNRVAATMQATPGTLFFVNVHPVDLNDFELYSPSSALGAFADRVVFEITERSSLHGISGVGARMETLRAMGYRIAIDDLGAGYAGLNSFALLEPEFVKLDMGLIRGVDGSSRRRSVIRAMLQLCSDELGIQVICEGVETPAEREVLAQEGGDLFQGYLFAKPGKPFPEPVF